MPPLKDEIEVAEEKVEVASIAEALKDAEPPFEVEVDDGSTPDDQGPTREELRQQLEESKRAVEELRKKTESETGLRDSFERLSTSLLETVSRPAPAQQPAMQQETPQARKERLEKQSLDRPIDTIMETVEPIVESLFRNQVLLARRVARSEDPETFKNYGKEIDELAQRLPIHQQNDPDAYKQIADVVRARHIDDIVAQRVKEELAKQTPPAAQPGLEAASPPSRPVGSLAPRGAAPSAAAAASKRGIRISKEQERTILARMEVDGIPKERFNDVVEQLHEEGYI